MNELPLNDRDIFAIYKVLSRAMNEAEFCFNGVRHGIIVTLKLQQYIEQRLKEEGEKFEENLKLNL